MFPLCFRHTDGWSDGDGESVSWVPSGCDVYTRLVWRICFLTGSIWEYGLSSQSEQPTRDSYWQCQGMQVLTPPLIILCPSHTGVLTNLCFHFQDTLLLLLKSLPMGCYFNIYSFGSTHEQIFPWVTQKKEYCHIFPYQQKYLIISSGKDYNYDTNKFRLSWILNCNVV